jgi:hypothetical protein
LVRFKDNHIYQVYIPLKHRVIQTSHCRFDEGKGLITGTEDILIQTLQEKRGNTKSSNLQTKANNSSQLSSEVSINKDQQVQIENISPHLSPPQINNLNNNTKSLIPDDFFSLTDKLIDKLEQQNNKEVIPPKITIYKKRG